MSNHVVAWIGGSLHLFVVCIKDIVKDEELLIDYGSEYWDVLSDWNDSQAENKENESKASAQ